MIFTEITGKEKQLVNDAIANLLRRGRNTKIHLILATQEATKQNLKFSGRGAISAKMAFLCSDMYESQAIIGVTGAEKLMGQGAMKFKSPLNGIRLTDMQGSYIPEDEIDAFLKTISYEQRNMQKFTVHEINQNQESIETDARAITEANSLRFDLNEYDTEDFIKIIKLALERGEVSNNTIKDEFLMGYNRANRFMRQLEDLNFITKQISRNVKKSRTVIPNRIDDLASPIIELLLKSGMTKEQIEAIMNKRTN